MAKTFTAPLAVIKVNGQAVGKLRNIRVTESIRRVPVKGLGQLAADELPPVDWTGNLNAGSFSVDFEDPTFPESIRRKVGNIENFVNTLLLDDAGIQIDIFKKERGSTASDGVITPRLKKFASVSGAFITRESFDVSEGQVSGRDVDFEYINPIVYQRD